MLERGMDENEVSQGVVRWLQHRGYEARALTAGQRGIDIAAWHPDTGHKWAIEAKGSTSSKTWTKAHGAPISEGAAYNGVSKALLNAIFWTGVSAFKDTSVGIAVPDDKWFDMWLTRIEPACKALGIAQFRAHEAGVRVIPEGHPDTGPIIVSRPTTLLRGEQLPRSLRCNYPYPPYPGD